MKKFLLPRIGVADDQSSIRPSLHDCIEAVLPQADALMQDVLEGLSRCSTGIGAKGSFGNPFPVSKAVADLLCSQSSSVKKTFVAHLQLGVYKRESQDFAQQAMLCLEDLKLLDSEQIDASIDFALARQEVSRCVDDVLPSLDALISSLLGWTTVQPLLNPLRTDVFVCALQACLKQHVPSEPVRAALFITAAGLMGVSLRQLYREICDWLRSQGVEPATPVGANLGGGGFASETTAKSSVGRTLMTFDKLRRLLTAGFDNTAEGFDMQDFLHTVPAAYVALEEMKLVEPMMRRLAQRASLSTEGALVVDAASQNISRGPSQSKQLGTQLGEEVVRMMLDRLMRDERLLLGVREFIARLEPTLLAIARSDPRFFSERQHPARQFLDRLTHRSLSYTRENDAACFRFLRSVANAVDVLSGSGGVEAFAQVLRRLEEDWRLEDLTRSQRQEVTGVFFQTEQNKQGVQRFADDFEQRQQNKKIPHWLASFLREPWAQVVAQAQLSTSDDDSDPDGYLALVDDLIWSVQPRLVRRDRVRLVQLVPDLLSKLRQGLQLIEYPQERLSLFFDALVSMHEKALAGPRRRSAADSNDPSAPAYVPPRAPEGLVLARFLVPDEQPQASGKLAQGSQPINGAVQRPWSVAELNPGAWFELFVNGVWLRAQLSWVSPQRTLFMFVSLGGQAHSMSRRTMERLRIQGSLRCISEVHVADSALDVVAQTALQNELVRSQQVSRSKAMAQ